MTAQALLGQTYPSQTDLWASLDERREVLNQKRNYFHWRKCAPTSRRRRWFRGVRATGFFGEGAYQYYLDKHLAQHRVAIRFDAEAMALICLPEGCEETIRLPIQGISKAELMGALAVLQSLPIYQLALPFSLAAWRQLEYAHNLIGTTL